MPLPERQIPYNYTSAGDLQIINYLFNDAFAQRLSRLEPEKETGRSSRLLLRFIGDLFIIERNPFLQHELITRPRLRKFLFAQFAHDLKTIETNAGQDALCLILEECRKKLASLKKDIQEYHKTKQHLIHYLAPVIGRHNIYLDAFTRCAHVTDATDWRLFLPAAVLRPDKESQVSTLVKKIQSLGYHIIPRGGGTGLTGGVTPLRRNCMMLNTEKLNAVGKIEHQHDEKGRSYASIRVGAGAITQDVIDYAKEQGYIFATDPTSAWACTIGGNLSENAGGKKAVLFGTAIDNVLSYNMVMPDGTICIVRRKDHPLRKIKNQDTPIFEIFSEDGTLVQSIRLDAQQIRKKGLGKDVTNKYLNGLPGIQKEGCDGIITSARFILYPQFAYTKTVCVEFFGSDMAQAGKVIALITDTFADHKPAIMALEHFDEAYIKAIGYKIKTALDSRIIAVLLIDMASHSKAMVEQGIQKLDQLLEPFDKTGVSIAQNPEQAQRFWQDRKRLGAIAAHTNSFKLNEDIVLPIESLASFASWVDRQNIEEKKINQDGIIKSIINYLEDAVPLSDPELLKMRVSQAKDLAYRTRKKLEIASRDAIEAYIHANRFYRDVMKSIHGYPLITTQVEKIYDASKSRLIVIATHMHAGDGNVHVNIPVLSNDREMMIRAHNTADMVMKKAIELNGVVSGEHGIGVTKVKFLDTDIIEAFKRYRQNADPQGVMNPGKFEDQDILQKMFAPSFNLMDIEARILNHTSLSDLARKTASCVRCGKCKISCPVFYPKQNLFYHPRNKNMAKGMLIESLLYITQRTQSTGFGILKRLESIAGHCTLCHKCFLKCPVNIDSGHIAISERQLLSEKGFKKTAFPVKAVLSYLGTRHNTVNQVLRQTVIKKGALMQRTCSSLLSLFLSRKTLSKRPAFGLVASKVAKPDNHTLRRYLPLTVKNQTVILEPVSHAEHTVFYFPGCGSERIFSTISMAAIFLLLKNNTRVLLPPSFLCCGYPFMANGKKEVFDRIMLENSILFSRIRSMFQDLCFDAVLVSCGTCMDSLSQLEADRTFGCKISDVSEFVLSLNSHMEFDSDLLYHAPCHDSLKNRGSNLLESLTKGHSVHHLPHCCSEAGTMAMSTPLISKALLDRKQRALNMRLKPEPFPILTNCPSCLQGLGRLNGGNIDVLHLTQALARSAGGENWEKEFQSLAGKSEVVTF